MAKVQYNATSVFTRKGSDLPDIKTRGVRHTVGNYLGEMNANVYHIYRPTEKGQVNVGYVGFNRSKGVYFWINRDGECKAFDPRTGLLGKKMVPPKGTKEAIRRFEKENREIAKRNRRLYR